eukprot:m.128664 g.128664  ORF g.128664 m.128664 type:complete len:51 (-) comp23600_c0_seq7:30-182(-)
MQCNKVHDNSGCALDVVAKTSSITTKQQQQRQDRKNKSKQPPSPNKFKSS